jgi:hypothetical protein
MTIPLHSKIMEILKKYDGNFQENIRSKNTMSILKCLWKAKINEPIHGVLLTKTKGEDWTRLSKMEICFYIGRRSFVSNNYGKIPTSF